MFVLAALLMAGSQIHAQEEHQYVDLGLPSGTLWATCNVGATTPEGKGDHFAWGETTPQPYTGEAWRWSTYKYCKGNDHSYTKYCQSSDYGYNGYTDNLTVLVPEDDAATANWGAEWRTPSMEEWKELKENTRVESFTMNGVWGFRYTAPNGNSIFLPGAGENHYFDGKGKYWSSTLYSLNSAYCFWYQDMTNNSRVAGCSVRPVRANK